MSYSTSHGIGSRPYRNSGLLTRHEQYFEQLGTVLPRQSTADYLTGCTDPNERQFALGLSENDVPSNSGALEAAFLNSPLARTSPITFKSTRFVWRRKDRSGGIPSCYCR